MKTIPALAVMTVALLGCGSQPQAPAVSTEVPPQAESLVQPTYPEEARKAGATGTSIVEVTVGADGAVLACSLTASSENSFLDSAALGAARSSKFAAGTKDGKPVEMKVKVPFRFKLGDSHSEKRSDAQGVKGWAGRFVPALPAREV